MVEGITGKLPNTRAGKPPGEPAEAVYGGCGATFVLSPPEDPQPEGHEQSITGQLTAQSVKKKKTY